MHLLCSNAKISEEVQLQALLRKNSINCGGRLIFLDEPVVMGILNMTPDSFYKDSRMGSDRNLLSKADQMIREGALFIDIGGQSTRPGAEKVSMPEELERVVPAIRSLIKTFPDILISVDTFYAEVARQAVSEGACLVNDVSAGDGDKHMFRVIGDLKVPYIMMHKKEHSVPGSPVLPSDDIILEIASFFSKKLFEISDYSVPDIILDPGLGFGKTLQDNYEIINRLSEFKILELPLLIGVSRKSMIQKVIGESAENALNGTTALNMAALLKGADILRVHDVKEAVECIQIFNALNHKPITETEK